MGRHGWGRGFGVLIAASLIAAACSSTGDSGADATPESEGSTTTQAEAVESTDEADDTEAQDGEFDEEFEDPGVDGALEDNARSEFAGQTIGVLFGDDQPIDELVELLDEFTSATGIIVEFDVVEDLSIDASSVAQRPFLELGGTDVVMVNAFDATQLGVNGLLEDLTPRAVGDRDFDIDDLLVSVRRANSVDGALFASPFYASSSIIMYNQEILDAAEISVPNIPTWAQIGEIARRVDTESVAGICMNGFPGWEDMGATLTTVVNGFGGTWWEATAEGTPGEPQINQPESGFRAAVEFYVELLQDAGPRTPRGPSSTAVLSSSKTARWLSGTTPPAQRQSLNATTARWRATLGTR